MSVIPEILLQRVIVEGYRALRKDPRLLDSIFRNLTQDQLAAVKEFILERSVHFSINYPRQDLKVPALVLVLKNESENVPFLGDSMATVMGPTDLYNDTLGGHGGSTSTLSGLPAKLAGPLEVLESDDATVTFADDEALSELLESPPPSALAYVVSGTGVGQVHPILRIRPDALDIVGTFDPYLDSTSRIDIRSADASELPLGEPSRVYESGENRRNLRQRGAEYEVTYHLHVIAGGQDEVVFLYSAIKALLLSQRPLLESQGIIALRISGSDFAPRTEYLPSEVFQRMMVLTFTYPFSFVEELDLPDKLVLNIIPDDPEEGPAEGDCVNLGVVVEL